MSTDPAGSTPRAPRRLARRWASLLAGLVLFGVSIALMVAAGLGLDPWDVFQQGIARRLGFSLGTVVIGVSVVVLLLWIPLRQKPGVGTLVNAVLVGLVIDVTLPLLPRPAAWPAQAGLLVAAVALNGVATGLYIGGGLGPGPRDGLMTGLAARGHSIRVARTSIEVSVLLAGWLLGGTVGIGTLVYAVSIGPLAHYFLPRLAVRRPAGPEVA